MTIDLEKLTTRPGVYQMLDATGQVLYVGKARNLRHRLSNYFRPSLEAKTQALMQQVERIEVSVTANENEALLLESNLIKQLKPRYNILLRDDKSYPYLFLSSQDDFPRLDLHRGAKRASGQYFGPYPSVGALRETLTLVQKLFKIRQCSDSFFKHRTRPCLQYYIKRCTAPCVNTVDIITYQEQVRHAVLFLHGKNNYIIEELAGKMEESALSLNYEEAAQYRDQIANIRRVQTQQTIDVGAGDVDVIAGVVKTGIACIHVMTIRSGRLLGCKSYFPKTPKICDLEDVLMAFIPQYYCSPNRGESIPRRIIVNLLLSEREWIKTALSQALAKRIDIVTRVRGHSRQWQKMAKINAEQALQTYLSGKHHFYRRLETLQHSLGLLNLPQRLECFDVSHTMGEATVASCVVFTTEGAAYQEYRRFNITGIKKGDDYAALAQALARRYKRMKMSEVPMPDVLIIDGGKGQLKQAEQVLETLQISGVLLLSIAKGALRKPGFETIFISGRQKPLQLSAQSEAFHVIQHIRDEAHRFAITGHRKQRDKKRHRSFLEDIHGIGSKRRRELLRQFGGLQEIRKASVEDLTKVPGISKKLAQEVFDHLHS